MANCEYCIHYGGNRYCKIRCYHFSSEVWIKCGDCSFFKKKENLRDEYIVI